MLKHCLFRLVSIVTFKLLLFPLFWEVPKILKRRRPASSFLSTSVTILKKIRYYNYLRFYVIMKHTSRLFNRSIIFGVYKRVFSSHGFSSFNPIGGIYNFCKIIIIWQKKIVGGTYIKYTDFIKIPRWRFWLLILLLIVCYIIKINVLQQQNK